MSCFGGKNAPNVYDNCCNGNRLCKFNGNIADLDCTPIYVQKVYDAVVFNLQGMKTSQNQAFAPKLPENSRIIRVTDIRCKKHFNPGNVNDTANLKLTLDTSISGASFIQTAGGDDKVVVGADGELSEKVIYTDTSQCDDRCMGTPVFGTQNIGITGNVTVYLDLLICDSTNHELIYTVSADINVAAADAPLLLTNFFEICIPSTYDTAFFPRFTEFCNSSCETRLATNNMGRDLAVDAEGNVTANLIIAICVTCEKKVVVPVQICVLSTGEICLKPQTDPVCTTFPSLFPQGITKSDTEENCEPINPECKPKPDKCKPSSDECRPEKGR